MFTFPLSCLLPSTRHAGVPPFPQKSFLALHASLWKEETILATFEQSIVPYVVMRSLSLFHTVPEEHLAVKPAGLKPYVHRRNGYCLGCFCARNARTCTQTPWNTHGVNVTWEIISHLPPAHSSLAFPGSLPKQIKTQNKLICHFIY